MSTSADRKAADESSTTTSNATESVNTVPESENSQPSSPTADASSSAATNPIAEQPNTGAATRDVAEPNKLAATVDAAANVDAATGVDATETAATKGVTTDTDANAAEAAADGPPTATDTAEHNANATDAAPSELTDPEASTPPHTAATSREADADNSAVATGPRADTADAAIAAAATGAAESRDDTAAEPTVPSSSDSVAELAGAEEAERAELSGTTATLVAEAPEDTAAPDDTVAGGAQVVRRSFTQRVSQRFGAATIAFVLLTAVFGAIFSVLTPPFWGHDEITQFGRAYQVSHGGLLPQRIEDDRGISYGGDVPASVTEVMGYALRDYTTNPPEPGRMLESRAAYDTLGSKPVSDLDEPVWFTNTAAYSPVPYIPAAIGIRVAEALGLDVGGLVLSTRIAGLLGYLLVAGFGLYALRKYRVQWLAFTVAVLPIAVFQAGTVTADTMTNALAVLMSALLVKALFLGKRLSRPEIAALLATTVLLPVSKPTYVLLAMLIVLVPPSRLGFTGIRRGITWLFALIGAAVFGIWMKIAAPTGDGMGLMRSQDQWKSVRPGDQLTGILRDPLHFLHVFADSVALRDDRWFTQFFGELGFAYIDVPAITILACLLAFAVSFAVADRMNPVTADRWRTLLTALIIAASVAMIYVTLYMSFTPVGFYIIDGVQGRYFVPLAIIGVAVLLRWVPLRFTNAEAKTPGRGPAIVIVSASVVALLAAAWKYYVIVWG
ncbi:DUF2142 domain-containing protein [Nocardia callitridis]|uniref:DUF2142 domain-containing protein n=1 Tax=Nocardia callitridis TaxID=648753 RepID=A0ABP9K1C5_9NOCA